MNVLVVSGIWPPDVGGPATHAPELATFLLRRGHRVDVVTTAQRQPADEEYPVHFVSRGLPTGARHVAVAALVARYARRADVVYATSMTRRVVAGSAVARRPVVVKVTADEAYERARRSGRFRGDLDAYQAHEGGARERLLRGSRTAALRRAAHVFFPSAYLQRLAIGWGLDPARTSVLRNAAPLVPLVPSRAALRDDLGLDGPTLAFAGRLMAAKGLDVGLGALAEVGDVTLLVVGDGPDRDKLERHVTVLGLDDRVRFLGARSRDEVLRVLAAADGLLLSSAWENFPHAVVEALAVGTPVVATAVGGVPEVVRDGVNGLLVPPGDVGALAAAIRRLTGDDAFRASLAAAAAPSVADYAPDRLLAVVEAQLEAAAR